MLIVHNFPRFPREWQSRNGERGTAVYAGNSTRAFLAHRRSADAVFLINGNVRLVFELAASMLFLKRRPLIAVDLVLRQPETLIGHVILPLKISLLRRVDHFIHYFRDLTRLTRVYGIKPQNSSYVPFKVNLITQDGSAPQQGEYILCFGRSMRDFDTFLDAMERLPEYQGAITYPDMNSLAVHCSRFTRSVSAIPPNVRILTDDHSEESEVRILRNAKIVVLPIVSRSLVASGISTCLNAMYMGKCVIASTGPGISDIFESEVLTFPPENSARLAETIRRAYENPELLLSTAAAGRRFALRVGAEPDLYQRIVDEIAVRPWRV